MNKKSRFQRLKWASTGILLSLVLFALPASAAWNDTYQGYATYTGSGYSGGALLLDPIPSDMKITALNPIQLNYNGVKAALAGVSPEQFSQCPVLLVHPELDPVTPIRFSQPFLIVWW